MSWSLHIKEGDLSLGGPAGYSVVSGQQKLVQDVKNWMLEERGTDPLHSDYGSTLDGGTLPDGSTVVSNIGQNITRNRLLDVESELRRVLFAYQQQQLERLRREHIQLRGKNTFAPGEILFAVDRVEVQQIGDTVLAQIIARTESGQAITFAQPV